jgi:hypothetical protein
VAFLASRVTGLAEERTVAPTQNLALTHKSVPYSHLLIFSVWNVLVKDDYTQARSDKDDTITSKNTSTTPQAIMNAFIAFTTGLTN